MEKAGSRKKLGSKPEITRFKGLGEISPEEFGKFIGQDMRKQIVISTTKLLSMISLIFIWEKTPRKDRIRSSRTSGWNWTWW
jgi:topoisomerase-4 subunit B